MWPALEELAQGSVGPGAEQAALAVAASTTWVAIRASPLAWLAALGLVALEEGAAAVSVALEVAMEVVMEVALVVAEEWEVVLELVALVGLVALEELVALVDLVVLVDPVALALVALVQVASLGESRK